MNIFIYKYQYVAYYEREDIHEVELKKKVLQFKTSLIHSSHEAEESVPESVPGMVTS